MTFAGEFSAAQISIALVELDIDEDWVKGFTERLVKVRNADTERRITDPDERSTIITLRQLSDILGLPYNNVDKWAERRKSSGFPNPIGRTLSSGRGRHAHAFDRVQVRAWVLTKRGVDIGQT